VRQDGITMDEAREVVKQAFWSRLSKGLVNKYQSRYGKKTFKSVIKQKYPAIARRLATVWRMIKAKINPQEMSLPALLSASSPYHADFMPIYRAVTTQSPSKEKELIK
ncbi:MAG: hypothetical protein ABIC39_08190, partial [Pseudomonadota bacterium]